MKLTTVTVVLFAATIITPATGHADECTTVDYQGAPLEMCPPREPDPTNCYTGWYQGAPIEVCMPTGDTLPPGTIDMRTGEPPVIHVSKDYVPPTTTAPTIEAPTPVVESSTSELASIVAAAIAGIPLL